MAREKMWSRIHLIPLLQAEEDRDLVRRHLADQAREKELLGKNFKVYNSDRYVFIPLLSTTKFVYNVYVYVWSWHKIPTRYVRPTFAAIPGHVTK